MADQEVRPRQSPALLRRRGSSVHRPRPAWRGLGNLETRAAHVRGTISRPQIWILVAAGPAGASIIAAAPFAVMGVVGARTSRPRASRQGWRPRA